MGTIKSRLLLSYAKNRQETNPDLAREFQETVKAIRDIRTSLQFLEGEIDDIRLHLMGLEGNGTELYFNAYQKLFPDELEFENRNRRPPKDIVNAALSYGYAILNARVILATLISGMDPHGGFLHVDRSGRPFQPIAARPCSSTRCSCSPLRPARTNQTLMSLPFAVTYIKCCL